MQEMAPEEYRQYQDYTVNALAQRGGVNSALVEQYRARYAACGVNLTAEQAMDEIAADFIQALTLDAIRVFIRKVKSAVKGEANAQNSAAAEAYGVDTATLEEAAQRWDKAFQAATEKAKTVQKDTDQVAGEVRYSIKYDVDNTP